MSNDFLKVTDEAGVRTLQLNRPERKNALTTALGWGLVDPLPDGCGSGSAG